MLQKEKTTRRRFLKLGAAGAVLLSGGTLLYRALGRFGPPAAGWQLLDEDEIAVLQAAAEAIFPGPPEYPFSAKEIGCAQFVDRFMAGLYSDTRLLYRANLRALNVSTLVTHGKTFKHLDPAERFAVLETWGSSSLRVRRASYGSIVLFIKMGYFEDQRVRDSFGFTHGCDIPQEGRPQGI